MVSWPQTPPLGEFLPDPGPWSPGEDLHKEARRERRESRSRPGKWPNPVPGNQITPINHCQKPHVNRLCNVGEKIKGAIGWLHSQGVGVVIKLQPGGARGSFPITKVSNSKVMRSGLFAFVLPPSVFTAWV